MTADVSALQVVLVDVELEPAYRKFCDRARGFLVYYTVEYRNFLIDLLGCEARYLAAVDDRGAVHGILPLMEADGPYGKVLNSLPFFGSYGGALANSDSVRKQLIETYCSLIEATDIAASTIIHNPLETAPADVPHNMTDERIGQVTYLDLKGDTKSCLLSMIDGAARRNLKKADRAGVEVTVDNNALFELFAIHCENMKAIGGRSKPQAFFELLPRHFDAGSDFNLYVARRGTAIVSALLLLYAGNTVEYYIPATRLEERTVQPSAPLIFQAMIDAHEAGYRVWNWGGTWLTQEGVLRFKRKWGAEDRPYRYWTVINDDRILDAEPAQLLNGYPNFFVVPFGELRTRRA